MARLDASRLWNVTSTISMFTAGTRPKAPNLWQFLAGRCERVYVHFDRIPIDEVLRSISIYDAVGDGPTSGSMKWLHHRFELKDQMLEKFYFGESGTSMCWTSLRTCFLSKCLYTILWVYLNNNVSTKPNILFLLKCHNQMSLTQIHNGLCQCFLKWAESPPWGRIWWARGQKYQRGRKCSITNRSLS